MGHISPTGDSAWQRHASWVVPVLGMVAAVLLLLEVARHFFQTSLTTDHLYIRSLYQDLFVNDVPLKGWSYPASLHLVPDISLAFPLYFLTSNLFDGMAAYAVVLLLGFAAAISYALRASGATIIQASWGASIGALYLVAIQRHEFDFTFFQAAWHSGEVLAGIVLSVFLAQSVVQGWSRRGIAAFLFLGGIASVSDRLIVPHFLGPMAAAVLVEGLWRRRINRDAVTGVVLVTVLAVVTMALPSAMLVFGFRTQGIPGQFSFYPKLVQHFVGFVMSSDYQLMFGVLIFAVALALATVIRSFRTRASDEMPLTKSERIRHLLLLIGALSVAATMTLPFVTGAWGNIARLRYMFPVYVLPVLLLLLARQWADRHESRRHRLSRFFVTSGAVALPVVLVALTVSRPTFATNRMLAKVAPQYSEENLCLDRIVLMNRLRWGYSEYFEANVLTESLRSKPKVLMLFHGGYQASLHPPQFFDGLHFLSWIRRFGWPSNAFWYVGAPVPGVDRGYFVLTDRLPPETVASFGSPDAVETCGRLGEVRVFRPAH